MTKYITWPKDIDEAFRAEYLAVTGEKIQELPRETVDGAWCVGSSRITADQAAVLPEGAACFDDMPELKDDDD